MFTEMASVMPLLANITWERILAEESVTYPCDAPDQPGNEIIFVNSFPTKSGRARIVPAELLPPDEVPDQDYPMVLTTGRLPIGSSCGLVRMLAGASAKANGMKITGTVTAIASVMRDETERFHRDRAMRKRLDELERLVRTN